EDQAKHVLETPAANRPYNIDQLKAQLRDYRYCGLYDSDVADVVKQAKDHLEKNAKAYPNPAIVLDIDETALSNWLRIEANDFGFTPAGPCGLEPGVGCGDFAWELSALAEPIKPTLDLFNTARRLNVEVFFITGRRDRA